MPDLVVEASRCLSYMRIANPTNHTQAPDKSTIQEALQAFIIQEAG